MLRGVCAVGFVGLLLSGNGGECSSIVAGDTEDIVGLAGRTGEGDGIEVGGLGEGNVAVSRSAFLSEAEDQMMRIGDVTGGEEVSVGAVSWDFGSGEGVDCEIDFG
jgi:hypothetical protein